MKKCFKKSLVYLIMTMLVMPTWLVTGMINAQHAKADSHKMIVINEFVPHPALGDNEWIELFNNESTDVSLDGWYIKDNTLSNVCAFGATDVIPSGSYWKCELTNKLNDASDVIQLYDNSGSGISVDSKGYDKDPGVGSSIGRISDGSMDWGVFDKPSEVSENLVAQISPAIGSLSKTKDQDFQFNITVTPNATYNGAMALVLSNEKPFSEIFQSLSFTTGSDPEVNVLTDEKVISYGPISGFDLTYGSPIVTTVKGKVINSDEVGTFNFGVALYDDAENLLSNIAIFDLTVVDSTAPVITLNGASEITLNVGDSYTEQGVIVTDNKDNNLVAVIGGDAVDTSAANDYIITYNVADLKGNLALEVTRTVHVINKVLVAPIVNASVSGKTITATWNKVEGATGYYVYMKNKINGSIVATDMKAVVGVDILKYQNNVSDYGNYYLVVVAYDNLGNISTFPTATDQKVVPVSAPIIVTTAEVAPVVTSVDTSAVQSNVTAEPTITTPVVTNSNTNGDENGQIKGDESQNTEDEKVNWTPWIVLFVLILLAGAATGGYFYWFAGEDEVASVVKEPKKEEKIEKVETTLRTKQSNNKPNKKSKRW